MLDYVLLRGGCDIHTIAHCFSPDATRAVRKLHEVRDGLEPTISHSIMLCHAVRGTSPELRDAAQPFGFRAADFMSLTASLPPPEGQAAWVCNFTHDNRPCSIV